MVANVVDANDLLVPAVLNRRRLQGGRKGQKGMACKPAINHADYLG